MVSGDKAYGYLKSEARSSSISKNFCQFDSNARRHTSFSCLLHLQLMKNVDIQISPEDIRVDTYRSSGAGGQSVNKTDSAIRITHP